MNMPLRLAVRLGGIALFVAAGACGTGGSAGSTGTPVVTSITPLHPSPTAFVVVGSSFLNGLGSGVTVVFDADGGATPFAGGTSAHAEVPGTITGDTTIAGTSPAATIVGPAEVDAFVTIRFAGGFEVVSAAAIAAMNAPVVAGFSSPIVESEIATAAQVTGSHFGTAGLAVTVTFHAASGTPFAGGTTPIRVVAGTVASDTSIDLTTPVAGTSVSAAASVEVDIVGVGHGTSAGPVMTFAPPTVAGFSAPTVDSENPTPFTVAGSGIAGPLTVQFVAAGGTPFLGGTAATVDAAGTASLGTQVDGTTPRFGVSASTAARIRLIFTSGAVAVSPAPLVSLEPPAIPAAPPLVVRCEYPTPISIAGSRFGSGLAAVVRFTAIAGTPFVGGTAAFIDVAGTATSTTTVAVTSPQAVAGPSAVTATVRVTFPSGASATSGGALVTFDAPSLGVIAPLTTKASQATAFTLPGTGFAPVAGTASVRFTASAGTPFAGGTSATATVSGAVASDLSITGTMPVAVAAADFIATVDVTLTSGSRSSNTASMTFEHDAATYRWQTFNTYDNAAGGWMMANTASLYGGVAPSNWTDLGYTAGNMSTDRSVLGALFTNKGYADKNAMIWSKVEAAYSSTNGEIAAVLFRVRNATGSPIVWTPSYYYSAFNSWGERASVAVNGVDVWTSGATDGLGQNAVALTIPASATATVIFTSALGPMVGGGGTGAVERAGQFGIFNNGLALPAGLTLVDDLNTPVPYRWQTFNTYDNATGWLTGNSPTLYGGVNPSNWTDNNATAGSLSADPSVLATMFTRRGYGDKNALIWSKVETQYSSTNGEIAAVLFRVKNTTGSAINWSPSFHYSAYWFWSEVASVAVNGVDVWTSGTSNTLSSQTLTISIPANATSTVVFTSALGPALSIGLNFQERAGQLAFFNDSLLLPAGLAFVDDLSSPVPYRWQTFNTYDNATNAWLMGNNGAMYGGVNPVNWTDGNATAGNMSADPNVLRTLFTNKGCADKNALIWSEVNTTYSSTSGEIGAFLFRVKNTTGSPINWTPWFYFSCYATWNEAASVAVNGVNVWTSGALDVLNATATALSIPAGGTSTVIFTSSLGPQGIGGLFHPRGGQFGIFNDGLVLPAGLTFVDDL